MKVVFEKVPIKVPDSMALAHDVGLELSEKGRLAPVSQGKIGLPLPRTIPQRKYVLKTAGACVQANVWVLRKVV